MNLSALEAQNPWWVGGRVPAAMRDTVPRRLTPSVVAGLAADRATVVLGPRRVGKTVLVHQVVGRLLERGVAPRSIVYLSADDPLLGPTATLFEELLAFIEERLLGGSGEPVYVLVDEVHVIADWPLWVKRSIDRGRPLAWLVTSSAGSILHRGSRESLAGRVRDVPLLPFSLAEAAALVRSPAAPLLERCAEVWESQGVGALVGERAASLVRLNDEAFGLGDELMRLSRWYLRSGGFPEALAGTGALSPREYLLADARRARALRGRAGGRASAPGPRAPRALPPVAESGPSVDQYRAAGLGAGRHARHRGRVSGDHRAHDARLHPAQIRDHLGREATRWQEVGAGRYRPCGRAQRLGPRRGAGRGARGPFGRNRRARMVAALWRSR